MTRPSDELERWLAEEGDKTLGDLIAFFEEKAFAMIFIVLLGVSATPLPTGGTWVLEVIAIVLAVQLIFGRSHIWLPQRWRAIPLDGERSRRFLEWLLRNMRRLERISRPRGQYLFGRRETNAVFGLLVIAGSVATFLAPPFTGLDTLPALAVVLISLGVLLEDILIVAAGIVSLLTGVLLELVLGRAAYRGVRDLF